LIAAAYASRVAYLMEPAPWQRRLSAFNREQQGDVMKQYYMIRQSILNPQGNSLATVPLSDRRAWLAVYARYVDEASTWNASQLIV
jgi:hypothetical protein